MISIGSLPSDSWKLRPVPWKLPCTVAGMPISATARAIAAWALLSERLGARLKEIVVATKGPWWLTASGVLPGAYWLKAASGTTASAAVLTAAPVETTPWPVLARLLVAWLRAVSAAMAAAVLLAAVSRDTTVPATALVAWVPLTVPPAALTQRFLSVSGLCQYSGATSMIT